jgi:hypothetical protein
MVRLLSKPSTERTMVGKPSASRDVPHVPHRIRQDRTTIAVVAVW